MKRINNFLSSVLFKRILVIFIVGLVSRIVVIKELFVKLHRSVL